MLKPPTILPMGLVFQPAGTKRVYYMGLMGGSKMTGCQRTLHTSHPSEREIENKGENGRVKERTTHPKLGQMLGRAGGAKRSRKSSSIMGKPHWKSCHQAQRCKTFKGHFAKRTHRNPPSDASYIRQKKNMEVAKRGAKRAREKGRSNKERNEGEKG